MHYRYIIAILTCEKNKDRLEAVRETWVKDFTDNSKVFYVFARPGGNTELTGNILYLDCPESYEEGPRKVVALYNFLIKNFDFDYIYKCDDDTYVDVQAMLRLDLEGKDYIGNFVTDKRTAIDPTAHYGKCSNKLLEVPYQGKFLVPWARGGRGYLLSKRAAENLCKLVTEQNFAEIFEDKMVGEILSRAKDITTLQLEKAEMPSLHPIQASEMYLIHGLHKSLRSLLEETPKLKEKLLGSNETLQQQKEKNLLLKENNEALSAKNKTILDESSLIKTQKNEFADKNVQLKSELTNIKEQLEKWKIERKESTDRNSQLKNELTLLKEQLQELKTKKNSLLEKNKKLARDKFSLESELAQIKQGKLYKLEQLFKK